MKVIRTISELKHDLQQYRVNSEHHAKIGLVPTMGFLHHGHASLMTTARELCDVVVVSVFVNPIQFGPGEDYETYPRDEERDLALAEKQGVDIVFIPTVAEMYPQITKTKVRVSEITDTLCGASRPGHFDGVTTVVSKLFNMVQPHFAFFGQKDAQQVAVLQQMVMDLNINVKIVPCPIVREDDGLALSSRNVYLSIEERKQALVLSRSLREVETALHDGKPITTSEVREKITSMIQSSPLAMIEYVEVLTFPELIPVDEDAIMIEVESQIIIALAVKFGTTRLIDNMLFMPKEALSLV